MNKIEWLLCPVCKSKTRIKLRPDTVLENFPLFCPKCKQERLINVKEFQTAVVTEPDEKRYCDYIIPILEWNSS